jgi:branched-chain amino acid transport system permease protein
MRRGPLPSTLIIALVATGALASFPLVGDRYQIDLGSKVFVLAIFALSLELLVGQTGLVSLGHAAFMALGAYTSAFMLDGAAPRSVWVALPAAMAAAGAYALPVAALSLRTRGVYFIMVTLAFAQLVYFVLHDTRLAGGSDGMSLAVAPQRSVTFYYTALAALAAVAGFLALLARSRFGRALDGIRVNEQRMRAAGFSTYAYKIAAFVVAAMLAGLAGFLKATRDGYVNPELGSWRESGAVLVMIIFGGLGRLRGAVAGAFAFVLLEEVFKNDAVFGAFARRWQLMLGLTIIACVLLLPDGLAGLPQQIRRRLRGGRAPTPAADREEGRAIG